VTNHNSIGERGRQVSPLSAQVRELGISRLDAWKWSRLGQIPEDQFEALLKDPSIKGTDGILRAAGKLSPDRPRAAGTRQGRGSRVSRTCLEQLDRLIRELLETASESELACANAVPGRSAARCFTPRPRHITAKNLAPIFP
jgi:hypothetical protein